MIQVQTLDHQVCKFRKKYIALVKVLLRNQFVEEPTWEDEEYMRKIHISFKRIVLEKGTNSLLSTL